MLRFFALPFVVLPLVELYLLLWLSRHVGFVPTVALTLVTGGLGAWLAHREGVKALSAFRRTLSEGRPPEIGLIEGALILVGGVLLVTPGVLTDSAGFALLWPVSRRWLAERVRRRLLASVVVASGARPKRPPVVVETTGHDSSS